MKINPRKELQSDFYTFYRYAAKGATGWWLKEFCDFLQYEVYFRFLKRELPISTVEAPVQHGKSRVLRHFLCWLVGLHPELRFNFYTASEGLRDETKLDVDMILSSPEYLAIFGQRKSSSLKDTEETFQICSDGRARGKVNFRLMGAGNIGHPSDVSLIDDPYRNSEDAHSVATRAKVAARFRADIITRRQSRSMVVVVQSRWHKSDLIGWIKNSMPADKVVSFSYPAILPDGTALFPQLRSLEFINEQRSVLTPSEFSALYQMSPTSEGGNKFKEEMFELVDELPEMELTYDSADTAYKEAQENDFHVIAQWGVFKRDIYLMGVFRGKIQSKDAEGIFKPFIKEHSVWGFRGAWIEPKGHGIYLNQKFAEDGELIMPSEDDVKEFFKDRRLDKVERANNAISMLNGRKIKIYSKIFCKDDLVAEAIDFPNGANDDFADTLIDAIKLAHKFEKEGSTSVSVGGADLREISRKRNW
jgi:phage terminase large subunit-like protein